MPADDWIKPAAWESGRSRLTYCAVIGQSSRPSSSVAVPEVRIRLPPALSPLRTSFSGREAWKGPRRRQGTTISSRLRLFEGFEEREVRPEAGRSPSVKTSGARDPQGFAGRPKGCSLSSRAGNLGRYGRARLRCRKISRWLESARRVQTKRHRLQCPCFRRRS